jgi:hypothetical protein
MFRSFASNIVDDVKKLGKGSFGTVILGYWKSRHIFRLSFYRTKLFWARPNWFGQVQNVDTFQKQLFVTKFHILISKTVWTCLNHFGRVQNSFGPKEGQGISIKVTSEVV